MSSIVHASDPTDFYRFWSGNEVWSLRIGQLVELLLLIITSPERVTGMSLPPYSTEQLLVLSGEKTDSLFCRTDTSYFMQKHDSSSK